jgi:hypothetical protein
LLREGIVKVLDISVFTKDGIIAESAFFEKIEEFDWEQYRNQRVLVSACGNTIIPPWAFMVVTARLAHVAKTIRYGNEHSSVLILRRMIKETADADR